MYLSGGSIYSLDALFKTQGKKQKLIKFFNILNLNNSDEYVLSSYPKID